MKPRWPRRWVGTWCADDGRSVTIERQGRSVLVTVRPVADAGPYASAALLDGTRKAIFRLPACTERDARGALRLSVEAGSDGIGPSYHLEPLVRGADGALLRPARHEPPSCLVLVPRVTTGLYGDWEDDLGVPWAFPLASMRWVPQSPRESGA
ncbi:hypothetical protein FBY24_0016 [Cellulomonas sp. SLBN-39]|nr:hypothetical protein FBY24_0016 [Cellulomonas sp. SLBN-39]